MVDILNYNASLIYGQILFLATRQIAPVRGRSVPFVR